MSEFRVELIGRSAIETDFLLGHISDQMNNEDNIEESIVAPLANASLSVRVRANFEVADNIHSVLTKS